MLIPNNLLHRLNNIYFLKTTKRKRLSFLILLTVSVYLCYFRPPYTENIVPFIFIFLIICYFKYSFFTFIIYCILDEILF